MGRFEWAFKTFKNFRFGALRGQNEFGQKK